MNADDGLAEPFVAALGGHQPRPFVTLHDAVAWVESVDRPTGVIRCIGVDVICYDGGGMDMPTTASSARRLPRRPVFMVSTDGKTPEQMKADARRAFRRYQWASRPSTNRHRPDGV